MRSDTLDHHAGLPRRAGARTPTWAWLAPGLTFVVLLAILWPRPYLTRAGDELYYYIGARALAEDGQYYEDFTSTMAVPITRHPPLLSLTWSVFLRMGFEPVDAFAVMQAMFLFGLGALGGALAYRVHGTWLGPLVWTVLNACWPGGSNWWLWTTPHAESGIMFFFILVAWLLVRSTEVAPDRARGWLLAAALSGGLAMTMKGTGVFCFPVIGAVVIWHVWVRHRRYGQFHPLDNTTLDALWRKALFLGSCAALMMIPYALWGLRNLQLAGVIESDKYVHGLNATWAIMTFTTEAIMEWIVPATHARPAADAVHPALILGPFLIGALLIGIPGWRRRIPAAMIPWAIALTAYGAMTLMMTWMYTHEARFWAALLPCLTLGLLAVRGPRHPFLALCWRLALVGGVLYLCLRFAASNRRLWYGTTWSYLCLQGFVAISSMAAAVAVARVVLAACPRAKLAPLSRRAVLTTPLLGLACGAVLILFWRSAQQARPIVLLLPLLVGGIGAVMIATEDGLRRSVGVAISAMACVATWTSGNWSLSDFVVPAPFVDVRHGIPTPLHPDTHYARRILCAGKWPKLFASNRWCYLDDMFERAAHVGLPRYPDRARFVRGEPQDPQQARDAKLSWVHGLRARAGEDAIVVVHFPNQTEIDRAGFFSSYYGPEELEGVEGLDVEWVHKEPALHIAIMRLTTLQ